MLLCATATCISGPTATAHLALPLQEISSLRDFYEVNLELTRPGSPVSIYDVDEAIVSRGHILPPAIIHNCEITHSLVGEGSVLVVSGARQD